VKLVEEWFKHRDQKCTNVQLKVILDVALHNLLDQTACKDDFVKKELLDDVKQIVTMLLHN
jgi:hypothetical protein